MSEDKWNALALYVRPRTQKDKKIQKDKREKDKKIEWNTLAYVRGRRGTATTRPSLWSCQKKIRVSPKTNQSSLLILPVLKHAM